MIKLHTWVELCESCEGKAGGKPEGPWERGGMELEKRQINMKTFFPIAVCHSSCSCCVRMTMATSVQNNMPATMHSWIAEAQARGRWENSRKTAEIIMKEPEPEPESQSYKPTTPATTTLVFSHVKAAACKTHTNPLAFSHNFPCSVPHRSAFEKKREK